MLTKYLNNIIKLQHTFASLSGSNDFPNHIFITTVIVFLFLCLNSSKSEIIKNDQLKNSSLHILAKGIRRYSIIPFIKEL